MESDFQELKAMLPPLPARPAFQPTASRAIAPGADLAACLETTIESLAPLVHALVDTQDDLDWHQTYTLSDGVSADFLNRYGYICLSGPDAPLKTDTFRLFIAYWGAGLTYPDHNHEQEELYCSLAGEAIFTAETRAPVTARPGATIHHPAWVVHATQMTPGPYLSLVGWIGDDLTVNPRIVA